MFLCLVLVAVLAPAAPAAEKKEFENSRFTPSGLNLEDIRGAIARGVEALYGIEPNYTFGVASANHRHNHNVHNRIGHHSLAAWALLDAGESYQNPTLYRRINWILSSDTPKTYDRGSRAQMLAELPFTRWAPWVNRDYLWLAGALTDKGGFTDNYHGNRPSGWGDHANGQYGTLGLWGIQRAGQPVPRKIWEQIDTHWRKSQANTPGQEPAGWALGMLGEAGGGEGRNENSGRVSGPMTAGGVSTLMLTERYLYGREMMELNQSFSPNLSKGIAWLDNNFLLNDPEESLDRNYYYWTVQSVGRTTGYRTFNGVDWYRDVTSTLLSEQRSDGAWTGPQGTLVSTSFAMLYMSKANDPVAVAKARFKPEGSDQWISWHNYPHDIWNFVDYISDEYEYSTTWQIVDLDQPAYALIETPLLYISTDQQFTLTDEQLQNLRDFTRAGGMLLCNADGNNANAVRSFNEMAKALWPEREMTRMPKDHMVYGVHQHLAPTVAMEAVSNGIRPLMIRFVRDIGRGLQSNATGTDESFVALSNLYLYAAGKNPRRGRLENNYIVQQNNSPSIPLQAALIKYDGNYNPEPGAWDQLKSLLANEHDIDLQLSEISAGELGPHKIAFLTTTGLGSLSAQDANYLRRWVEAGGMLWIDAASGSQAASEKAFELLATIVPNEVPVPLSAQHPLINGRMMSGGYDCSSIQYRFYTLQGLGPVQKPRLQAVEMQQRPAIVYSPEDLTCGLAGLNHWGIDGYSPDSARKLVVNGCLMATRAKAPLTSPVAQQ